MSFFSSKRNFQHTKEWGVDIYLIKVKTPKGISIFATNLPKHLVKIEDIRDLYKLRWQVETGFYNLTQACHLEKWHSKTLNGIKQELYLRMWIFNVSRMLMAPCQQFNTVGQKIYQKANFKLILSLIRDNLYKYWTNITGLSLHVNWLVTYSNEKREVDKKQNPREIKSPRSPYKYGSTEWQWDKNWALS